MSTHWREIAWVVTTPPPSPGFIGEGHLAVPVLPPGDLESIDPFVRLMDDRLDMARRRQIGGAHPHAGLETVTLVLEGTLFDRDEGELETGDIVWMTAGRGIIHNEHVEVAGRSRILQLWLRLAARDREAAPDFEVVRREAVPVHRASGVELRLYSGAAAGLSFRAKNLVPMTLADVVLAPSAALDLDLPPSYNGFAYVLEGAIEAGAARTRLRAGDVGWLSRADTASASSAVSVRAGDQGARAIVYAGEPQRDPTIHYGPFVAGSQREVARLFAAYYAGRFESMSAIAARKRGTTRTS